MGANKGKTFELNYGKIHGSREYYMKVIVNPGSGAFLERELKKQVNEIEKTGKSYDTNARWVIIVSNEGKVWSDYCNRLIGLAKGSRILCNNKPWKGDKDVGNGKVDFIRSKKHLHATYWMKSNKEVFIGLVCIEKAKGACTREGVRILATSSRSDECADGPPLNDVSALAHIETIKGLPKGDATLPKDTPRNEPVELNDYYNLKESTGNKITFQKNSGTKCLKFLEWKSGYMTTTEMTDGVPVISGKFSGCPFIKYRYEKKKFYVTHIGTCDEGLGSGKKAWNAYYDKNNANLDKITCFDPFTDAKRLFAKPKGTVYAIADNSLRILDTIYIMNVGDKGGPPQQGQYRDNNPITALKRGNTKFKKFDDQGNGCT